MPTPEIRQAKEVLAKLSDEDRRLLAAEFGLKTPVGLRGILSDGKLPITFIGWIVASISTWQMMKGSGDAMFKQQVFQAWLYASAGAWSAVMVAMGYQTGKAREGTVPEGRMAIPQLVVPSTTVVSPIQTASGSAALIPIARIGPDGRLIPGEFKTTEELQREEYKRAADAAK